MKETAPSDKAYDYIIDKIKNSEWEQGMKIASENELCDILGVSRVAVRQALEKLVALGLLVKRRGSGTYVNKVEAKTYLNNLMPILLLEGKDIFSVLEFRKYFEYGNVKMFIQRYDEKQFEALEEQFEIMKISADDPERFFKADYSFHSIIARGTENPVVAKINEILMDILIKHQQVLNTRIGPSIGLDYHERLLRAISERDEEMASLLMLRHIQAAIDNLKDVFVDGENTI